jgi:hypothetical protein
MGMTRFTMVKQSKGVWDLLKSKDGPWMLFEDHEKITADRKKQFERDWLEACDLLNRERDQAKAQLATANEEIARLREALGKLHGLQNGCPLPKYEADYLHCMQQVERLLCLDKEYHL